MRRFVFLVVLCSLSLPVSLSVTGCYYKDYGQNYCSGFQSGPTVTATSTIVLQPSTYGVSINFGATNEVVSPTAYTCKGTPSGLTKFSYGTSDPTIADVSPTGQLCGGMWNRNTGNGVADYTTCIPTNKTGIAYITASGGGATSNDVPVFVHPQVTSVQLVSASNLPANDLSCITELASNPSNGQPSPNPICTGPNTPPGCVPLYNEQSCVSQNLTAQLFAVSYATVNGVQQDITCNVGHLSYTPQNTSIVTVDQNGVATAHMPGATVINATVAQASSTAGYFFTCPPKSINLNVGTTPNTTSVTLNQGNIQPLTTTVTDTQGNLITGLPLTYTSTNPINIAVSNTGMVTANFPSDADITVQCMPNTCNSAPQDQIGNLSSGLPITSNPISVHTPGPTSTVLYMSNPWSYGFVPIDFLLGTVGTPVQMPYLPNSMVMNEQGTAIYFGSATELMVVSTATNALITQNTGVPGTVLAVSHDNNTVVIHDPCRKLFYLYNPGKGTALSFPAPGPTIACNANSEPIYPSGIVNPIYATQSNATAFTQGNALYPEDPGGEVNPPYSAAFTLDDENLYITYSDPPSANTPNAATLFAYSRFTGWHACTDNGYSAASNCPAPTSAATSNPVPSVTVTVPGVGLYASTNGGPQVSAYSFCSTGPNNAGQVAGPPPVGINPNNALNPTNYYPPVGTVTESVDQVSSTVDGHHIIGATAASGSITDINVTIPPGACPLTGNLQFGATPNLAGVPYTTSMNTPNIGSINQVLTSPTSGLAFVTFYPAAPGSSNSTVPAYKIPPTGGGSVVNVPLTGSAGAPIAGVFSPDTNTFYVGTNRDNLVHLINTTTLTDTQQLSTGLLGASGTYLKGASVYNKPLPAFFMAAKPRPLQGQGEGTTN